MRYKKFGKTGLEVSEICLGTWGIGGAGWDAHSDEERMDAIKAALDCGINFIDTAPAYNAGRAEQYIGETLHCLGARKHVILTTKCGNKYVDGKYIRCGSEALIRRQCEESLRNLQTDYIDLYLVHWPDPNVSMEETIGAVAQSRKKVEENCAGLEWQLTEDEMHRLDQAIQRYQFPVQCGEVYQRR